MGDVSQPQAPTVSRRVQDTAFPVIVKTKQLMAQALPGRQVLSLAQGVVHWRPPPAAITAAAELMAVADGQGAIHSSEGGMRAVFGGGGVNSYGPADGLPALVDALQQKIADRNGLPGHEVMVTNGANQAFVNIMLTLVDSTDKVVLFTPYYFNHLMALQMTGGADRVLLGPCHCDNQHPDLGWLQQQLTGPDPPRMVVIVNPCNPTGVVLSALELESAAAMCAAAGAWLILDNTYEDFVYNDSAHHCVCKHNVIHIFSFSKAYGMMGWRVGYIAYPGQKMLQQAGLVDCNLGDEMRKIQDTIAICPSQLAQHLAIAALQSGSNYIQQQIAQLQQNREVIADALSPLGSKGHGWVGGEGAIYFWAKLPDRFGGPMINSTSTSGGTAVASASSTFKDGGTSHEMATVYSTAGCAGTGQTVEATNAVGSNHGVSPGTDEDVVAWLIREHGVCVIPGSACGAPGYIRVAYANLTLEQCREAAARLKAGLQQLLGLSSVLNH